MAMPALFIKISSFPKCETTSCITLAGALGSKDRLGRQDAHAIGRKLLSCLDQTAQQNCCLQLCLPCCQTRCHSITYSCCLQLMLFFLNLHLRVRSHLVSQSNPPNNIRAIKPGSIQLYFDTRAIYKIY